MNNDKSDYYDKYWKEGIDGWNPSIATITPEEQRILDANIAKDSNAVDIGCGGGRIAEYLLSRDVNYLGIDISKSAVDSCKNKGINALECDFSKNIPLKDDSYDSAICFEVLEHLTSPSSCMTEIYRILKPDGIIIGSVPNIAFVGNRLLLLLGLFNTGGSPATSLRKPWKDPHIRFFTVGTLKSFIEESNFKSIKLSGKRLMPSDCPLIYRLPILKNIFNIILYPFRILGTLWPSLFAARIYFFARK